MNLKKKIKVIKKIKINIYKNRKKMSRYFSYVYLYPLLRSNQQSINYLYREFEKKYLKDENISPYSESEKTNKKENNKNNNLNIYKYLINIKPNLLVKKEKDFNSKEAFDNFCFVCMMYI